MELIRLLWCETCGKEISGGKFCSKYCATFVNFDELESKSKTNTIDVKKSIVKKVTQKETRYRNRILIFSRDKFQCIYCGKTTYGDGIKLHIEHIIPRSKKGTDQAKNLVTSCSKCNLYKGIIELSNINLIKDEVLKRNELSNIENEQFIKV